MPALRNPSLATAGTPGGGEAMSAYEQSREERIRENLATMQKLGIFDLSLNLKLSSCDNLLRSRSTAKSRRSSCGSKTPPSVSPLLRSEPTRRSSRLKNGTPVSYSEVELGKKSKVAVCDDEDLLGEVGSRPEIYTEEHEKLLGSTEKSWKLFVNGYGSDGKRIYDQVKGQTCHQCRQKTLGYRTHCIECNKVQGQFCGDCLYMRYGEHVLEAMENPEWICPVCRGICNCSLCRQAKGWAPTGALYKKVTKLGYKSVAHFLIQTRRLEENPVNKQDVVSEVSVKRSLAFSDVEPVSKDSVKVTDDKPVSLEEFKDKGDDEFKKNNDAQDSAKQSFLFSDGKQIVSKISMEKEMDQEYTTTPKLKQISCTLVTVDSDSIAGRLKQTRRKRNDCDEEMSGVSQAVKGVLPENEVKRPIEVLPPDVKHQENTTTPKLKQISSTLVTVDSDSVAGRLKQRRRKINDCDEEMSGFSQAVNGILPENEVEKQIEVLPSDAKHLGDGNTPMAKTPKLKQKLALAIVPSEDSIAGRLRQRHKMGNRVTDGENSESR